MFAKLFAKNKRDTLKVPQTIVKSGADNRNRTGDLRITSALLCQLSYVGING